MSAEHNPIPAPMEDEYQTLVRALRRKRGFGLYFVECNPQRHDEIAEQLHRDLADQRVKVLGIAASDERIYDQVQNQWEIEPFDVLVLTGFEGDVVANENASHVSREPSTLNTDLRLKWILPHLNQQRERFRDHFSARFVLILSPFLVDSFIQNAPDFFDWRSGLFRLSGYGVDANLKERG